MTVRKLAKQRFGMASTKERCYSKGRRVKLICSHKEDAAKEPNELHSFLLDVAGYYWSQVKM